LIVVVVVSAVLPRTCARLVHVLPSVEVSTSKSRVSHCGYSPPAPACRITTEPTCLVAPRSSWSHLDEPVEHHLSDQPASLLPLTALSGPSVAPHDESAVTVVRSARSAGAEDDPYTSSS
jgi:hypothetical protein